MSKTVLILILFLVLIGVGMIFVYNKLVKNKNRMQEAWSGIDVFLKKRYNLVPALVETVKAYVGYEKNTLEEVTRLRSEVMEAKNTEDRIVSETGLGRAIADLFVVVENYPELKASANFSQLHQQLVEIEDDLALSRRYYNGTVRENNILMESFPSNIVAGMCGFKKGNFFVIDSSEREVLKF